MPHIFLNKRKSLISNECVAGEVFFPGSGNTPTFMSHAEDKRDREKHENFLAHFTFFRDNTLSGFSSHNCVSDVVGKFCLVNFFLNKKLTSKLIHVVRAKYYWAHVPSDLNHFSLQSPSIKIL